MNRKLVKIQSHRRETLEAMLCRCDCICACTCNCSGGGSFTAEEKANRGTSIKNTENLKLIYDVTRTPST